MKHKRVWHYNIVLSCFLAHILRPQIAGRSCESNGNLMRVWQGLCGRCARVGTSADALVGVFVVGPMRAVRRPHASCGTRIGDG
jgi:hypothetical protein